MDKKVFVVLDDQDQVMLQSICMDKDPEEALYFVLKRIAPKLHKQVPCIAREIMKTWKL
ncbi:MAG: hypothetical protein SCJ97_07795 [Bacillota bacterium]|nr:hypothetical protein [Bacillota bacterium]